MHLNLSDFVLFISLKATYSQVSHSNINMHLVASPLPLSRDAQACLMSSLIMITTVECVKALTGLMDRKLTRKIMHLAAGPVFMLTWPFFSAEKSGRLWAAAVPLGMTLKFALTGLGVLNIAGDVEAMSRSGERKELLRGPLIYGLVFTAATILAFREVIAAASLMALCAGDGMADVVGRRWGGALGVKLPWSPRKSWPGSCAFLVASFGASAAFGALFHAWGWSTMPTHAMLAPLLLACLVGAAVESLPFADVDNVLVPSAVAAVLAACKCC